MYKCHAGRAAWAMQSGCSCGPNVEVQGEFDTKLVFEMEVSCADCGPGWDEDLWVRLKPTVANSTGRKRGASAKKVQAQLNARQIQIFRPEGEPEVWADGWKD
jgi:hypothetical protein